MLVRFRDGQAAEHGIIIEEQVNGQVNGQAWAGLEAADGPVLTHPLPSFGIGCIGLGCG
jgi:hypothetical protein